MANLVPPTAEEFQFITDVSSNYGVPIRRASELYYNSPDISTANETTRILRRSVESTLGGVSAYCLTQFQELGIDHLLDAHQKEIQVYPQIDVFNSVWNGIPEADTRNKAPFVNPLDFLAVSTSDTAHLTLEKVKREHEEGSIPATMHDAVLKTVEALSMTAPEAMNFLMKFLDKSFPLLTDYGTGGPNSLERSRVAFQRLTLDYENLLAKIRIKTVEGESLREASQEVLGGFYSNIPTDVTVELVLTEMEAEGIREICKIQRRPYSEAELEIGQVMVDHNRSFTNAVTAFHYLLTDYSRKYFAEHPERMQYTFRDFNTLLLVFKDETGQVQVAPNPDMLSSFSDNWFGSIARNVMQREVDQQGELTPSEYTLTPSDIFQGILNAKRNSVFRMRIGTFTTGEHDEIRWNGTMLRVCPAEKIATDAGAEVVPRLYESLRAGVIKRSSNDLIKFSDPEALSHELANTLLTKLRTTDTTLFITGESSTGKSRITQEISRRTGLPVIDVGMGYRLAAYLAGEEALESPSALMTKMSSGFAVETIDGECRILHKTDGDITDMLRTSEVEQQAASVGPDYDEAILQFLRSQMNGLHVVAARNLALAGGENSMRVNLSCKLQERALRRARQRGREDVAAVIDELRVREQKGARHYITDIGDIIEVDTTALDVKSTTIKVMEEVNARIT